MKITINLNLDSIIYKTNTECWMKKTYYLRMFQHRPKVKQHSVCCLALTWLFTWRGTLQYSVLSVLYSTTLGVAYTIDLWCAIKYYTMHLNCKEFLSGTEINLVLLQLSVHSLFCPYSKCFWSAVINLNVYIKVVYHF